MWNRNLSQVWVEDELLATLDFMTHAEYSKNRWQDIL